MPRAVAMVSWYVRNRVRLPSSAVVPAARLHLPSQEAHIVGPAAMQASRKPVDVDLLQRLEDPRRRGVLADLVGVPHRDADRGNRSSVQIACSNAWYGVRPFAASSGSCMAISSRFMLPATCFIEISPMPAL